MSQLGPLVTSMLPLVITRKGAMENCVFDLINFDCASGNPFLEVEKKLKELYAMHKWRLALQYTLLAKKRDEELTRQMSSSLYRNQGTIQSPRPFHADEDWQPSSQYLQDVWQQRRELSIYAGDKTLCEYQRLRMTLIKGMYWRADHTFKFCK